MNSSEEAHWFRVSCSLFDFFTWALQRQAWEDSSREPPPSPIFGQQAASRQLWDLLGQDNELLLEYDEDISPSESLEYEEAGAPDLDKSKIAAWVQHYASSGIPLACIIPPNSYLEAGSVVLEKAAEWVTSSSNVTVSALNTG